MKRMLPTFALALLSVLSSLTLTACGGGSDEGHVYLLDGVKVKKTVDKAGVYDIDVNCTDCELTIGPSNTVKRLVITGISNRVSFTVGGSIEFIEFTGRSNTVYIPKGQKPRISDAGGNNTVREL